MPLASQGRWGHNIFVQANIFSPEEQIARLLALIGQPVRVQILLVLGDQAACVCHLEAVLGMRQASISQHLMVLRKAELVQAQREGRNIFYHLTRPAVLDILRQSAALTAIDPGMLDRLTARPVPGCPCPQCNPGLDPQFSCTTARSRRVT